MFPILLLCYLRFVLVRFEDIVLLEDSGVPTEEFLNCCKAMLPFFGEFISLTSSCLPIHSWSFVDTVYVSSSTCTHTCCFLDTMNSTAFSPVKSDINGNIEVHCRQCSHVGIGAVSLSNYSSPLHPSSLIPPHRNY